MSIGKTNGSLYAIPAAMVNAGDRHPSVDAVTSIFPTRGSTGKDARCLPSGVSVSDSRVSAPIVTRSSMALWTDFGSGG